MPGYMDFSDKRDMDMMAALLIGKGKVIQPRKGHANQPWRLVIEPQIRWSSEREYRNKIAKFDDEVRMVHGINIHPRDYNDENLNNIVNSGEYWMCGCEKIRVIAADRCFTCSYGYPNSYEPIGLTQMRNHLIKVYDREHEADASS